MVLRARHKRDRDNPDKPPKTTTTKPPRPPRTTTTPAPVTTTPAPRPIVTVPTGPIQTPGFAGKSWDAVTQYDQHIRSAADPVGWPADRVRGHILIESGGDPRAHQVNASNGDSYGLLQIVPFGVGWAGWHELVKETAGLSVNAPASQVINALYDPRINIAVGVAILESLYQQYGSLDTASSAFFLGNPNWRGQDTVNGNTGTWYRDTLNALIAEQRAFGGETGTTAAPLPRPDVLDAIYGGQPYDISAYYGQLVTWSCPGCYDYQTAYGLDSAHHYAYDTSAHAGDGAPLYAPFDGTVVCAGTGQGSGAWGTGCAAFARVNNYGGKASGAGSGRLEILHANGTRSLILGHVLRSHVRAGDRVTAGQRIGEQGGMNGSHAHCEGRYANGTRIGDPRVLFGGGGAPITYAPRQPFVLSDDNPELEYVVTADEVPVRQYANPSSAEVREPLKKGETFSAGTKVLGTDGAWWHLTSRGSRIPVMGTKEA